MENGNVIIDSDQLIHDIRRNPVSAKSEGERSKQEWGGRCT
jgi:hypothetical protein